MFDAARRVNRPPNKRSIGMVFQSYALWPHMTVRKNIAYPLKARKLKQGLRRAGSRRRPSWSTASALLDRYPAQLSGGQQQRVALARGLVARPDLVLFDEPLSNLDARLRDQVRIEIHELHTRLGFTAVFVTHDQSEALALGDRLAIMKQGKIEQYDTPEQVYEQPASEYVAAFIGISNRLAVRLQGRSLVRQWPRGPRRAHPRRTARRRRRCGCAARSWSWHRSGRRRRAALHAARRRRRHRVRRQPHRRVGRRRRHTRLMARLPTASHGGWVRGLQPGDAVEVSFDAVYSARRSSRWRRRHDGGRRGLWLLPSPSPRRRRSAAAAGSRRPGCSCSSWPSAISCLIPLYRLQAEAFRNGAEGYRTAYTAPGIGRVIGYTVVLALGSLAIALVLGTLLAWAASRLPRRLGFMRVLPILPIVVPAVANVVGWAFLFSPRPGYLNHYLRMLPWWNHLTEGPVDIYTMPWIVILTGFGLTSFVYLFVSAGFSNISAEHLEAAHVAGSSTWGVFFKVILPLLRPTLIYGGGVALLLGLGQFTAPLLLGRNSGIDVITTNMYSAMTAYPTQYGTAAALGSPLLLLGIVIVVGQKFLLGNQRRFVTHTGRAFRARGQGIQARRTGASCCTARWPRSCRSLHWRSSR